MPFELRPYPNQTLRPDGEYLQRAWRQSVYPIARQMGVPITLPKVKWGLIYGVILCNARSMGEFGAVSVLSGHIRGKTNTMPLHIEILYNEYQFAAAFAVAALLSLLAVATLGLKAAVEWRARHQLLLSQQTPAQ